MNRTAELQLIAQGQQQYHFRAANLDQLLLGIRTRYGLPVGTVQFADTLPHHIAAWSQHSSDPQFPHSEHFEYHNNSCGFRCAHTGLPVPIMAFGCSVTYGVGVPQHYTWSSQLSRIIAQPVANYGISGFSTSEMAHMFTHLTRFHQPKTAIFLLPEHTRIMLTAVSNGNVFSFNAFDNYRQSFPIGTSPERHRACASYYALPSTYHVDRFFTDIHTICTTAESRNIGVLFATWSRATQMLLEQQDLSVYTTQCSVLPFLQSDNQGRDQAHPGMLYHQHMAQHMADLLTV